MIQLGIIIGYLALLLVLGLAANQLFRGTAKDYMLASHSIGPFLLLMSLFGTTMTAFALVGSTGKAYTLGVGVYGLLASASGIMHSLCFLAIGIPLWSLGRRLGYATQIQFFRERLGSDLIGMLLFPILVIMVISYILLGVVAAGGVISSVTRGAFEAQGWFAASDHGVPAPIASATVCLVVMAYVFFGGMRGTAWANTFQTIVFMVLGVVTFVTLANALGGSDKFLENLQNATQAVDKAHLSRERIAKPVFFSFLLIPLSVAMFPHVFQHWLTARSAKSFKLPIVVHPIFIMIVWVPTVLIGTWASAPSAGIGADTNPNAVLATLVQTHAGPVLAGFLTAGILAAIMSSLDSQFLAVGSMFTNDVVLHYVGRGNLSDRHLVLLARGFVCVIVVVTFILSLLLPRAVFELGIWSFSGFCGLFPLVWAAIYWRRLTAWGGIASVVANLVVWFTLFWRSGFGSNPKYGFPEAPIPIGAIGTIPPMLPVVTIMLVSTIVLVAVSLVTRPPNESTLAKFFPPKQHDKDPRPST